jgi:hypothetical protein
MGLSIDSGVLAHFSTAQKQAFRKDFAKSMPFSYLASTALSEHQFSG